METKPQKIIKKKLSDILTEKVLELINRKQMKPGDNLPSEKEMIDMYGVGRSTVREAFHNLKSMGLIYLSHGERPRIVNPCLDEISGKMAQSLSYLVKFTSGNIAHLKEVRKAFEIGVVKLAAVNHTSEDIGLLSKILDDHRDIINDPTSRFVKYDNLVECDAKFHRTLAAISGNPIYKSLSDAFFTWISISHFDIECKENLEVRTLEEHERILKAIKESNPELAEKYMVEHLDYSEFLDEKTHSVEKQDKAKYL